MHQWEILVSTAYEGGAAAVWRDEGANALLTGGMEWRCGTVLDDYHGAIAGLTDDRTVQGGLLPPGASGAEVVDDRGARNPAAAANGAWVVVLEQTSDTISPVRFHDAAGSTVAPPLPEHWPRTPVDDATESCPACGACTWDEVNPLDEAWAVPGTEGPERSLLVLCRECGHQEFNGLFEQDEPNEGERVDPDEVERRVRQHELEQRTKAREALSGAQFPIYAVAGWPAEPNGWGWGERWPEDLDSIRISHGAWKDKSGAALTVESQLSERVYDSELSEVRHLLELSLPETGDVPQLSVAARILWMEARNRERRRIAAKAAPQSRLIDVDGNPQEFIVIQAGSRWTALSRLGAVVVTISATDVPVEDVRLESLSGPASIAAD